MALEKLVVAVDMTGGDTVEGISHLQRAAEAVARASLEFQKEPVFFLAVGDEPQVRAEMQKHPRAYSNTSFVHEPNTVPMGINLIEHSGIRKLLREPSTMRKICELQEQGKVHVAYSSGHSGAMVMLESSNLGPLALLDINGKRVKTTTSLASAIPTGMQSCFYLNDVGAIKDPEPINLFISSILTQLFAQVMYRDSREHNVGMLDTPTAEKARAYFRRFGHEVSMVTPQVAFSGNAGIVITDGFTGNIMLKTIEAVAKGVMHRVKHTQSQERFQPYFTTTTNQFNTLEGRPYVLLGCADPSKLEQQIYGILNSIESCSIPPRIGVLSNGEEDEKGNKYAQQLRKTLAATRLGTIGFVEPSDLIRGKATRNHADYTIDIVVTDPNTAAIYKQTIEAVENGLLGMIQNVRTPGNLIQYFAHKLTRGIIPGGPIKQLKELLNPENHNGSAILGIDGYAVIGHGAASAQAILAGIRYAIKYRKSNFVEEAKAYLRNLFPIISVV